MKESIIKAYEAAKEIYGELGVDVGNAVKTADGTNISVHCWQGDDLTGFENSGEPLSGGIQATGNYPGKARNSEELRSDIKKVFSLVPGKHKLSIHASYLESSKKVERNEIEPEHFSGWADWASEMKLGLDFNPTCFSHPLAASGYTISHRNDSTRSFWIEHIARSRKVAEYLGKRTGALCVNNLWFPDGAKEVPADRLAIRERFENALDLARSEYIDPAYAMDSVESKLFGIGSESFVVGSHELLMGYAIKNHTMLTLDTGHFHPTETVSNKLSAISLHVDKILLHISRPVRWDSDHVVALDDELMAIMQEIVRCNLLTKVNIGLDYFDASINRVAAWVIGARNARKALLRSLLEPVGLLRKADLEEDNTAVLALNEEFKSLPWEAVWNYYCADKNIPVGITWLEDVKSYEKQCLIKR